MSIVSHALTTRARQKAFLEIKSANDNYDSIIDTLINLATDSIEAYTSRRFLRTAYSNEEYDGSDSKSLLLRQYPVDTDQTFTLERRNSNLNEDDWTTIDTEDYHIYDDRGEIKLLVGEFADIPKKYKVTYTAGFYVPQDNEYTEGDSDSLPGDIEVACNLLVSKIFRQLRRQGTGLDEVSDGDARVRFKSQIFLDDMIRSILDGFKRLDI